MAIRRQYQTRQQAAVAGLFQTEPSRCVTAPEVCALLLQQGTRVSLATVYRALSRLCEEGTLRLFPADQSGEAARYQSALCHEEHLHIRCTECGAISHLCCDEVQAFARHLAQNHGYALREDKTMLYGVCESCRAKKEDRT